jgi:hypothetical protein
MSEGSAGVPEVERAEFPFGRAPIKGPLSAPRGPSDLQHPPRLHLAVLLSSPCSSAHGRGWEEFSPALGTGLRGRAEGWF